MLDFIIEICGPRTLFDYTKAASSVPSLSASNSGVPSSSFGHRVGLRFVKIHGRAWTIGSRIKEWSIAKAVRSSGIDNSVAVICDVKIQPCVLAISRGLSTGFSHHPEFPIQTERTVPHTCQK